jgi:hypothetical protein
MAPRALLLEGHDAVGAGPRQVLEVDENGGDCEAQAAWNSAIWVRSAVHGLDPCFSLDQRAHDLQRHPPVLIAGQGPLPQAVQT